MATVCMKILFFLYFFWGGGKGRGSEGREVSGGEGRGEGGGGGMRWIWTSYGIYRRSNFGRSGISRRSSRALTLTVNLRSIIGNEPIIYVAIQ